MQTSDVINQMADDLGSYQLLMDFWFSVEEVFDQTCTSDSSS
jgi:hypothetical protein